MSADRAVLVAPGASATRDHSSLVAIEEALAPAGVPVERIELSSRKSATKVLATVRDEAAALAARTDLDPSASSSAGGRSAGACARWRWPTACRRSGWRW